MSTATATPAAPARPAVRVTADQDGPGYGHEFFRPRSAVWWLFCVLVALGTTGVSLAVAKSFTTARDSLLAIAPIFALTLVLFAVIVLWADPYRARRPWILLLATVFGATVPTWLGGHANEHILELAAKLLPWGVGADWGAAFAGPTSEEWGKTIGVLVIMLVASRTLTRPMHGLLVGAFVGLGFQIFENVSYAANNAPTDANSDFSGAFSVTLLRSTIGISSHWLYSAIIGVGVAYLLGRTVKHCSMMVRISAFAGLYAPGWVLHFLWNAPPVAALPWLGMPVKVVLALVCFVLVARIAWRQEREYLARAEQELRGSPLARELPAEYGQPAVTSAVGTRTQRRRGLKEARKAGGRRAVKQARRARAGYLDVLQAGGRRGTGVDELPASV
ncbi:PrsW family intramembrane metalloprotease [Kocuria rhizophila]|uniref:PrsW family intramembrane metalloprotease n=1 Tax=Kocuria rhizophila TaxID=72000 RepID=UPI0021A3F8D2|nr:PrsW family intramembrane metalloprotease [Kocuria rhizophila]MCT1916540.1 PrsW family intramembrane metalloprotease [Kocuria rhizophila]